MMALQMVIIMCFMIGISQSANVDPIEFLHRFGYLSPGRSSTVSFSNSIKKYQDFNGLPKTGFLDSSTVQQMNKRRCGMPDKNQFSPQSLISTWKHVDLTYKITKYTNDMPANDIDRIIAAAFKLWSDVTPLTFTKVNSQTSSDMEIKFLTGDHNDGMPFDGPNLVLAHALYPPSGQIHFDDAEQWSEKHTYPDTNLFFCAAHEIGHSLGLEHSTDTNALMSPSYQSVTGVYKLPMDDIRRIQLAYGDQNTIPTKLPCLDKENTNTCLGWKQGNACINNKQVMTSWCEKTCGFCT